MKKLLFILLATAALAACRNTQPAQETFVAKGGDLGWLTEMEHDGMIFRNEAGDTIDCISLLQAEGMNAVRLRVWVNHLTGWSNLPDVLAAARRVEAAGLPLMIDLHYSDFFADPQRQDIPASWKDLSLDELCLAVGAHTTEVLEALRSEGITPRWIQIGNETTYGTLWPIGAIDHDVVNRQDSCPSAWLAYAHLSNCGYEAAHQVCPDIICITHVDNAFIPRTVWFENFRAAGGKWDMIGLSHYPFTQDTIAPLEMNRLCEEDVRQLYAAFACPIMIVEIGTASWLPDSACTVMQDFRLRMDSLPGYAGAFYWEPEVYGNWRPAEYIPLGWGSYGMGAMTEEGTPSEALKILFH